MKHRIDENAVIVSPIGWIKLRLQTEEEMGTLVYFNQMQVMLQSK